MSIRGFFRNWWMDMSSFKPQICLSRNFFLYSEINCPLILDEFFKRVRRKATKITHAISLCLYFFSRVIATYLNYVVSQIINILLEALIQFLFNIRVNLRIAFTFLEQYVLHNERWTSIWWYFSIDWKFFLKDSFLTVWKPEVFFITVYVIFLLVGDSSLCCHRKPFLVTQIFELSSQHGKYTTLINSLELMHHE